MSAANYSKVSGEELYARVNGEANIHPEPQTPPSRRSLFFTPSFPPITPQMSRWIRFSASWPIPLAHNGYFNVVYQVQAGLLPNRIDYLLRVHAGERPWRLPTVRTDKVTWGDDDLSPYWHGTSERSGNLIGPYSHWDERAGLSPTDISTLASFFQDSQLRRSGGNVSASEMQSVGLEEIYGGSYAHERAIILINAFRFEDVMKMKKDAPCVWSMFISVPLHQGLTFNNVLRTMARTATPYVGETTNGMQIYEVPPGKVLMGEPIEVQAPEKAPPPANSSTP